MGTPHAIRQRQYAERQHERGLRVRRLWLSDAQTSAVRELLQHAPSNGHGSTSDAELIATQEALRQAQSDLAQAQARIRDLESRQSPPPQVLARVHDLEADLAQLSRANAALRANLSDAKRAARLSIAGAAVVGIVAALALLVL